MSDPKLGDACGCCEGISPQAPNEVDNRPGLRTFPYRVGTWSEFKQTMLAALTSLDRPALLPLKTRDDDDFSIAFIDSWSMVLDILTFYQQQIANECHLRSAKEQQSVLELARLIGYELRPGIAASAMLAFTSDNLPGAPPKSRIDVGAKVQSIPGPDEKAQTFETIEALDFRTAWSALHAQKTKPRLIKRGQKTVTLAGLNTNLKRGDTILIVGEEREASSASKRWDFRHVDKVVTDNDRQTTRVEWKRPLRKVGTNAKVYALRLHASPFGATAPDFRAMSPSTQSKYPGGGNEWPKFTLSQISGATNVIQVDGVHPEIIEESWLVLGRAPRVRRLYRVTDAAESGKVRFALASKTTKVTLDGPDFSKFDKHVRITHVHAQSEELEVAEVPLKTPLAPMRIELDTRIEDFKAGRTVIVTGKRVRVTIGKVGAGDLMFTASDGTKRSLTTGESLIVLAPPVNNHDGTKTWSLEDKDQVTGTVLAGGAKLWSTGPSRANDAAVAELAVIHKINNQDPEYTRLIPVKPLANWYDRATVTIYGNIAPATHGETVQEILGNGDATQPFQKLALRQGPLTHVSAANASGSESTLSVFVNDVEWTEVPYLYGSSKRDRVFVRRGDEAGMSTIRFGDGTSGARPPSGSANIRATYRKGTGAGGNVKAGQLSQLMTRPLGVSGVTNPIAASGGQDSDRLEDARKNAPLPILTLQRVVSLRDYENFARGFPGIAKALATWTWNGLERAVFLTVAGVDGALVPEDSALFSSLVGALTAAGDPNIALTVASYQASLFELSARIKVRKDHVVEKVMSHAKRAVREAFSFDARALGQPVALSEIVLVLQRVHGVEAVLIEKLYKKGDPADRKDRLNAKLPISGGHTAAAPAELLTLDPGPFKGFGEMT